MMLVIQKKSIVDEFLNDFRSAYNKYFENKSFLKKNGDKWSVIVGFCKPFYPNKVFEQISGWTYITVELDENILYTCYGKEQIKEKVTGEQYLIDRWYEQKAKENKDIVELVENAKKEFIEYVTNL